MAGNLNDEFEESSTIMEDDEIYHTESYELEDLFGRNKFEPISRW